MSTWYLDYETFSECNLKKLGAWRYAADPSTRILLAAVARDEEPVVLWDCMRPSSEALELLEEMSADDGLVVAHNCGFEVPISHYLFQSTFGCPPPALHRWRDTAAMCRRACIPPSLKAAAEFLKLPNQKADAGAGLIKFFSVPSEKEPKDRALAWKQFGEYCVQDVEVMRQMWHCLKPFALDNHPLVLDSFLLDLRLNQRGIPVNVDALTKALAFVKDCSETAEVEFEALTDLKLTQTAKVLAWLQERGFPGVNLQASTMEDALNTMLEGPARRALQLRAEGAYAAVKKIPVMLNAQVGGRVRGCFLWHGATTGRWSGKLVQPQNFKRPDPEQQPHIAYRMIKRGDDITEFYDNPPEVLASCIRHFIELEGSTFLDGDFSNIEARVAPWLVGQEDMLEQFRRGDDIYVKMGAFIFNTSESEVTKDQRFVGKQACLGAQFSIGWKKFKVLCAKYGQDLDEKMCRLAVRRYREGRPRIVTSWKELQEAASSAVRNSGTVYSCNRVSYIAGNLPSGFSVLQVKLPSGRRLTYPMPRIAKCRRRENDEGEWVRVLDNSREEDDWVSDEIRFWGKNKKGESWGWQGTYGGKLLENCVAGKTEVLTKGGWVRIDAITDEEVWDGREFVQHQGLKQTENIPTIDVDGLHITADHFIFTTQGWVPASQTDVREAYRACSREASLAYQEFGGSEVWEFGGSSPHALERRRPCPLAPAMRLWKTMCQSHLRHNERVKSSRVGVLSHMPFAEETHDTWDECAPGLLGLAIYAGPLSPPLASGLEELRSARHPSMHPLGRIVRGVLGGYGFFISGRSDDRATQQQQKLQQKELRVENFQGTGQQQKDQSVDRHTLGDGHDQAGRGEVGDQIHDFTVQTGARREGGGEILESGLLQPVYDLMNCGPRHRFVVRGDNKHPLIVHNCVQAIAGDFLVSAMLNMEHRGIEPFACIHDQVLAVGDNVDLFQEAMTTLPDWAAGFPLEATCSVTDYYTKED